MMIKRGFLGFESCACALACEDIIIGFAIIDRVYFDFFFILIFICIFFIFIFFLIGIRNRNRNRKQIVLCLVLTIGMVG